ncbi:hypothetical protein BRADI_3g54945v3 [Brachypodium distachyon]|uniref:Uncharacterized protein n=1 Tax=Brachypodium distachyon TaxID=15368 RepID=A0A0Q3JS83_BRADI|nr:hypothetical protein BRADI_3g54945v3 [Brachypodium distachyon]
MPLHVFLIFFNIIPAEVQRNKAEVDVESYGQRIQFLCQNRERNYPEIEKINESAGRLTTYSPVLPPLRSPETSPLWPPESSL